MSGEIAIQEPSIELGNINDVNSPFSNDEGLDIGAPNTDIDSIEGAIRNPNAYEALFESPISGSTRSAHRNSANSYFASQLEELPEFAQSMNEEFATDVLAHIQSGKSGLLNPPGTVWHHPFNDSSVMQLLRTGEHTAPNLQPVLHPNGTGGFANFYGH